MKKYWKEIYDGEELIIPYIRIKIWDEFEYRASLDNLAYEFDDEEELIMPDIRIKIWDDSDYREYLNEIEKMNF